MRKNLVIYHRVDYDGIFSAIIVRKYYQGKGIITDLKGWNYGDMPLNLSLDLDTLPQIEQQHFVGGKDKVIPLELSKKWINSKDLIILPNATHSTVFVKIR
jgi:hypothetical protein